MTHAAPPSNSETSKVAATAGTFLGHPKGLFLLFMVEMWERFSYYGMRALLVLYLTAPLTGVSEPPAGSPPGFNPGLGWSDEAGNGLYGWYTGIVYLLPIIGGVIADKMIGTHRSMVIGGLLIALGHVVLAASGFGPLDRTHMGESVFILGLALIIIGTGHFKPSVSVMVGQLYDEHDPRRDGAFTIFYMGINLGAFLTAFVCGTLGERVGWHWGFGSAAVGMLLGLGIYLAARPMFLSDVGLPPDGKGAAAPVFLVTGTLMACAFAALYHVGIMGRIEAFLLNPYIVGTLATAYIAGWIAFLFIQEKEDRGPVASIGIFMAFNVFFWIAFEQAGSSINLFTDRLTDRHIFSWEVPTTWFQSINALAIFIMAPGFAAIWTQLTKRNLNPSQPAKIGFGLAWLGVGYICVVIAALSAVGANKASMWLVVAMYMFHTVGELFISPTGLSYVTKAAPKKWLSFLMGNWFISSFIAGLGGGLIAGKVGDIEKGVIALPWHFGGQADFFFLFVVTSFGSAAAVLLFTPLLKKLLRNQDD